ncbi:hypothetical protein GXW82_09170 [Streptacidiphilus sp. 4-A2]|nr:hypothetical protein [Streptacidiphilus sp. 4-A2]
MVRRSLWQGLSEAYQARLDGQAPQWEPLPVQYADYTLWQHNQLGDILAQQLTHWRQALQGIPQALPLPADRPRSAAASHDGDLVEFHLDSELHGRLDAVARRHGVTLFMVLHAALAGLLTRMGAGTDIPSARWSRDARTRRSTTCRVLRQHTRPADRHLRRAQLQ